MRALLALVATTALGGAALLLARPHGSSFAPITILRGSGFSSFVGPALLLSIVIGGSSIAATILRARGSRYAIDATLFAGGALTLFIANEITMMRVLRPPHVVLGAIGLVLLLEGVRSSRRSEEARHRWVLFVTAAEAIGFLIPTTVGIATSAAHLDETRSALLVVFAGAAEGLLCGLGQAFAFPIPIDRARFAIATACGATASWTVGLALSRLARLDIGVSTTVVAGIIGCVLALVMMGGSQWLVLRRRARDGATWMGFTALAWMLALPLSFAPGPLVDETTPVATMAVLWGTAGVAMAYVMALVTWAGARRLAPRPGARPA